MVGHLRIVAGFELVAAPLILLSLLGPPAGTDDDRLRLPARPLNDELTCFEGFKCLDPSDTRRGPSPRRHERVAPWPRACFVSAERCPGGEPCLMFVTDDRITPRVVRPRDCERYPSQQPRLIPVGRVGRYSSPSP